MTSCNLLCSKMLELVHMDGILHDLVQDGSKLPLGEVEAL